MQAVTTIGLNIAKSVFQVHGIQRRSVYAFSSQAALRCGGAGLVAEAARAPRQAEGRGIAMSRADSLRAMLSRCQERARYCEREFDRFCGGANLAKPDAQRQHRKLKADWDRALRDCQWAQHQLERALDVEGITL